MSDTVKTYAELRSKRNTDLYGIKGWLLVFVISLGLTGTVYFYRTLSDYFALLEGWRHIPDLWQYILNLYFGVFICVGSLYLIYIIYGRKVYAPDRVKIFLLTALAGNMIFILLYVLPYSEVLFSRYNYYAFFSTFIKITLNIVFTVAWVKYFNESARVNTIFGFDGTPLPAYLQCPVCMEILRLDEDERRSKPIVCPSCKNEISKEALRGSVQTKDAPAKQEYSI